MKFLKGCKEGSQFNRMRNSTRVMHTSAIRNKINSHRHKLTEYLHKLTRKNIINIHFEM